MEVSRRVFLKYAGALAGVTAVQGTGLLSLRHLTASEAEAMQKAMGKYEIKYTASSTCASECGLEVWIKDGVLRKIYGNTEVPMNDGAICAKEAAAQQLVYNPYRLKYPMIRVGARGENKFKRVTWSEAIDFLARKLIQIKKKYGAESIIMDAGDVTDRNPYWRLFFAFGTPHCTEHGAICDTPRRHGPKLIFGGKRVEPDLMTPQLVRQPDGSLKKEYGYRTKLIIYNGWNPFVATRIVYENRGTVGAKIENDCKIVVIDPCLSNTASQADKWLATRAGTDGDLFAAMLRYILENDNPSDPNRRYIDWGMKKYVIGWDDFMNEFKSWWQKKDPINGLSYFSLDWAADRTGLKKEDIEELAHEFGITKPSALVWGMQSPGHHYNGYCCSIIGTVLNVITGNFDAPGGAIDTELVKASKGGKAKGKQFLKRKVKRIVNGREVEGEVEHLHMDHYGGKHPAAWDDSIASYPDAFLNGVELKYGPFRGHRYPIKCYIARAGNALYTAGNPKHWIDAVTAKDANGEYKLELLVYIDTLFLETGVYADVLLPEAGPFERKALSDIYPSRPVLYNRDQVIKPLYESKTPFDIMIMLAKKLYELGDRDIRPQDFWEHYKNDDDFVNEMLAGSPGRPNVGRPLPYPQYPEGYKIIGNPESLEKGDVKIDHKKKLIIGKPVTVEWLRKNHGVANWPMSWYRYKKHDREEPNRAFPKTDSKMIEFVWDYEMGGKRMGRYSKHNKKIEESGYVPEGLREIGFKKFPRTFYWFETKWNPYTNPNYRKYARKYPFQVISGRVHHSMTATHMVPWLGEVQTEGTWRKMNDPFTYKIVDVNPGGKLPMKTIEKKFEKGQWCIGTIWINTDDASTLGIRTGDMIELENPLGNSVRGKAVVSEGIRPGVIKIGYGTGGRFTPGAGPTYGMRKKTPNHNILVDPENITPIMGFPGYADMIVRVKKL